MAAKLYRVTVEIEGPSTVSYRFDDMEITQYNVAKKTLDRLNVNKYGRSQAWTARRDDAGNFTLVERQ